MDYRKEDTKDLITGCIIMIILGATIGVTLALSI